MRNGSKNSLLRKGLSLLLAAALSLTLILALPAAAGADTSGDVMGNTNAAVTIDATLTNGGYMMLKGLAGTANISDLDRSSNPVSTRTADMFGFYRVKVSKTGYERTYYWVRSAIQNNSGQQAEMGETLVIALPYAGDYKITVTPLTAQEINGAFLPKNRFNYWTTAASWSVSQASSNCNYNYGAGSGSDIIPPAAQQYQVTVNCLEPSGAFIESYTESVRWSKTIYPRTVKGYTAANSAGIYITCSNGYCTPASVSFYYNKDKTGGTVTVYCYDIARNYLQSYTETLSGSGTIYPRAIDGYTTTTSAGQYVSITNGVCNPANVFFYYMKNATSGTVNVSCYDTNNQLIRQYTETLTAAGTINPQPISGYESLSGGQYIYYSNGACSPSAVVFQYRKNEPAPTPIVPATLTVNCMDENGTLLRSYTEQLTESRTVNPQGISGYTTISSGQYVYYSSGACSPSAISFLYRRQQPAAQVTIRCIDTRGNVLRTTTESITASKTFSPPTIAGYTAASGSQQVTYSDGVASPSQIDFVYEIGKKVTPGSNPRMAYPTSWDTQFKPGTAKYLNGINGKIFDKLWTMYDDSAGSSFYWVINYDEAVDNVAEFTAYFDEEDNTISGIGIRNGNLLNDNTYTKYARVKRFEVWIYDEEGYEYKEVLELPDTLTRDYQEFTLSATYVNVVRVEFWITGTSTSDYYFGRDYENMNVCHLADIAFFK